MSNRKRQIETGSSPNAPRASDWFGSGVRVPYKSDAYPSEVRVFRRAEGHLTEGRPVTFLPGFPDGSFGWARVLPHLPPAEIMPKLFVEYVGQGDSDKPRDFPYGIAERADLIEAHWRDLGVTRTDIVSFDYSSLVVMELLSRRLERKAAGLTAGPEIGRILSFNGGLFADGHSHPWYTTPVLKTAFGLQGTQMAQRSVFVFRMMVRVLWSRGYRVSREEIRELHEAITRRDGAAFMSLGAGFVSEHRKNAKRLDFRRLYKAFAGEIDFLIGGSEQDPFEHRQIRKVRKRLGKAGPEISILPGGHLTTSEHPDALAGLISEFLQR